VFDEVDAGIGGSAATAVGRKLAELGDRHQVLVVTHLAQVASMASCHVGVSKQVVIGQDGAETTSAAAAALDESERVREVARLLSGDTGDAAMQHATELLARRGDRTDR